LALTQPAVRPQIAHDGAAHNIRPRNTLSIRGALRSLRKRARRLEGEDYTGAKLLRFHDNTPRFALPCIESQPKALSIQRLV
jgi:hypothetical protein